MVKVDIEVLGKMSYEEGAELLTAAGYVKKEVVTSDAVELSDFVRNEYWTLYDNGGETADTVSWTEYFNILKYNFDRSNDEEIIRAEWERMRVQWCEGCTVTVEERKAIAEALGNYKYVLDDEGIQEWIDDSTITLSRCRNGRDCVWVITDSFDCAVYVDSLEELSDKEVEEQLL